MSLLNGFEVLGATKKDEFIMSVAFDSVKINTPTAKQLEYPFFVRYLVNPRKSQVAIQVCDVKDSGASKFPSARNRKSPSITLRAPALIEYFNKTLNFDNPDNYYQIPGKLHPDAKSIIYNVKEAVVKTHRKYGRRAKSGVESTENESAPSAE